MASRQAELMVSAMSARMGSPRAAPTMFLPLHRMELRLRGLTELLHPALTALPLVALTVLLLLAPTRPQSRARTALPPAAPTESRLVAPTARLIMRIR